jgi:WD40 repeat protein
LVLSASSDATVALSSVVSVASEPVSGDHGLTKDGLLVSYDHHEDSVYCVEWSPVDPWCFASLSYDGRLLINRVPKTHKYNIFGI